MSFNIKVKKHKPGDFGGANHLLTSTSTTRLQKKERRYGHTHTHQCAWKMLATHILIHTFQHTLFDWLQFVWVPPNLDGSHMIWWDSCKF